MCVCVQAGYAEDPSKELAANLIITAACFCTGPLITSPVASF